MKPRANTPEPAQEWCWHNDLCLMQIIDASKFHSAKMKSDERSQLGFLYRSSIDWNFHLKTPGSTGWKQNSRPIKHFLLINRAFMTQLKVTKSLLNVAPINGNKMSSQNVANLS